jgi:hypothetical protein
VALDKQLRKRFGVGDRQLIASDNGVLGIMTAPNPWGE